MGGGGGYELSHAYQCIDDTSMNSRAIGWTDKETLTLCKGLDAKKQGDREAGRRRDRESEGQRETERLAVRQTERKQRRQRGSEEHGEYLRLSLWFWWYWPC